MSKSDIVVLNRLQLLLFCNQLIAIQPSKPKTGEAQQLWCKDVHSLVVVDDILHHRRHFGHPDIFAPNHPPMTILHSLAVHRPYHSDVLFPALWIGIASIDVYL